MRAAVWSFFSAVGRRGVTHAPVVELNPHPVCPNTEPESESPGNSTARPSGADGSPRAARTSIASAASVDIEASSDESLLSAYQHGDLDLLEACLTTLYERYHLEDVFSKLATGGKVKAADWTNALFEVGIDDAFVLRFLDRPGAHKRGDHPPGSKVPASADTSPFMYSPGRRSSFVAMRRSSRASADKETVVALNRSFVLLGRLLARRRRREWTGQRTSAIELEREDFSITLQVAQQARDCAERLTYVAGTKNRPRLTQTKYATLLAEHAAAAVEIGFYETAHEDLKAVELLCTFEPHLAVRSCIHSRPPAAQLLGFVIRSSSRELLLQERDHDPCPNLFGVLQVSLRICVSLTRLNKALMRLPELQHSSSDSNLSSVAKRFFLRRNTDKDSGTLASSAAAAAERLLNILQPRTVSLALAPVAFIADSDLADHILQSGWSLLDEAIVADSNCTVRMGLASIATHMGLSPPETAMDAMDAMDAIPSTSMHAQPSTGSSSSDAVVPEQSVMTFESPLPGSVATSPQKPRTPPVTTDVARAVVELERLIQKKSGMARSAALYGGAFLLERVSDHFNRTRLSQRCSTSNSRRTSVICATRRDSSGLVRSSTTSMDSDPSEHRRTSRAETWAGLASMHRLFDAMRPHMPPLFFEGRQGRVIPELSERLRNSISSQLEQEVQTLQARGWLQRDDWWSDLRPQAEVADAKDTKSKDGSDDSDASSSEDDTSKASKTDSNHGGADVD